MPKYFVFQKDSTYGGCQIFIKLYFKYDPFKTLSIIEKESTEIAQQQQMLNSFSLNLLFLMQGRSYTQERLHGFIQAPLLKRNRGKQFIEVFANIINILLSA